MGKHDFDWDYLIWGILIILTISFAIFLYKWNLSSYAAEPANDIFEPIPFEEQIKHDEDKAFHEYELTVDPHFVVSEPMYLGFTQTEIDLLARMCMSEASILSSDAKQGIVHTALARLHSGEFGNTIEEVINQPSQYSTFDNGAPDADCYEAVKAAIKYYETAFPCDMFYFREGQYHDFGTPYCRIGSTYFSTK